MGIISYRIKQRLAILAICIGEVLARNGHGSLRGS